MRPPVLALFARMGAAAAFLAIAAVAAAQVPLHWVHSATRFPLPTGAFVGGEEDGVPLVVCRAGYGPGVYPGKMVKGNCNISYGGREIYTHDYDVLVGYGPGIRWLAPRGDYTGAFIAGYENDAPLLLCQAEYRGGLHPGKVYRDRCDISYAGREIGIDRFGVLMTGAPTAAADYHYPRAPVFFYQDPAYDSAWSARQASEARRRQDDLDAQQREVDRQRADADRQQRAAEQQRRDLRDAQDQQRQREQFQRNMQAQEQQAIEQQRATVEAQRRQQADDAAARQRAEGEAEENRQALKAQAQAEAEAKAKAEDAAREAEIRRGEAEENRMAAEAQKQAEEDARRQAEIKQGEAEENRMAAEAARAAEQRTDGTPPQE